MQLFTDVLNDQKKALLISDEPYPLSEALLKYLKKHSIRVTYESSLKAEKLDSYSYVVFVKKRATQKEIETVAKNRVIPILFLTENRRLFENMKSIFTPKSFKHISCALIDYDNTDKTAVENILWFFLGQSDRFLEYTRSIKHSEGKKAHSRIQAIFERISQIQLSKRQKVSFIIGLILFIEFFFLIPLTGAGYLIYQAGLSLKAQDTEQAYKQVEQAKPLVNLSKKSYAISRPAFLLFFLSLVPENVISAEEQTITLIETAIETEKIGREISSSVLKTSKTPEDINQLRVNLSLLTSHIDLLTEVSGNLSELLDYNVDVVHAFRQDISKLHTELETLNPLVKHADAMLRNGTYLVFFYNNMELRPGGGFIGSFAIVTFQNYSLQDFKVYDVYDADGQLEAHVEPPKALRDYLNQPNWFLRDSNFSPDFPENAKTAEFFLEKELGLKDFDGTIGITTTGLTYILNAFGEIHIPDFNETVTKDNFYMKAQLHSEGDFFPGSLQKKSYLSTVGRSILFNLETASPTALGSNIKKAFDEKHIVFISTNKELQDSIDFLRWSGRVSIPECLNTNVHCALNHIMSIDANLGVNKANYYVNKSILLKTRIDNDGNIANTLATHFINNSPSNTFPGGTYKNYHQIYLPAGAKINAVDIDGKTIRSFDQKSSGPFEIVGIYLEVHPKTSSTLTVEYTLSAHVTSETKSYQLVVQKQIGSFNHDFSFELSLPDDIIATDQNFPSLAKGHSVIYNTDLSSDRIFVIDLAQKK